MSRRVVLKETAVYGAGTYLSQVLSAVRGIVIAGMLGPSLYGLWKVVQVGLDYLSYSHFGALHGMARLIPSLRKEGDLERDHGVRRAALAFTWISAFIGAALTMITAHLLDAEPGLVWMGVAALLIPVQLFRYLHMVCIADGRFAVLSLANLALAAVSFGVMLAMVPSFQVMGVLAGLAAGYLAGIAIGCARGVYRQRSNWYVLREREGRQILASLLAVGFPFMTVDALFVIWQGVDRLALATVYGANTPSLGHYGLAAMISSFAVQFPQIFTRVLFRRTVRTFGSGDDPRRAPESDKLRYVEAPVIAVAGLSPILFTACLCAVDPMLRYILPEYVEAYPSIVLLLFAAYWISVGLMVRHVYTGSNRQFRLGAFYAASIAVTLAFIYGDAWLAGGRLGVLSAPIGMAAAGILFALTALLDTARYLGYSVGRAAVLACKASWPVVPFAAWAVGYGIDSLSPDSRSLLLKAAIGFAASAPAGVWAGVLVLKSTAGSSRLD